MVSERTATEQLMDTVRELVYDGAQESVVAILEKQIAINTRLETENQALRDFVAADDELRQYEEDHSLDSRLHDQETCEDWYVLQDRHWDIRNRLATEHGLPLPGAGEGVG